MVSLHESNAGEKFNLSEEPCPRFSLVDIEKATNNFTSLVIGEGAFAKVYKGEIEIDNGGANSTTVAIKRMDSMSPESRKEFRQEISMVYKFRHSHLVSLIGYCETNEEMILVYEYMGGGTLKDALHKSGINGNNNILLSWVERLKISVGAARGLHYLHTGTGNKHKVIHRDVKSSNILLDENRKIAKISDFELLKIGPTNQTVTGVFTRVAGTRGYWDPDYYSTGILTSKSDVYSFGVVLFELLCGRPALDLTLADEDQWNLVAWAHQCVEKGKVKQIVDPNLKSQILPSSLSAFVKIAERCLHVRRAQRPTMTKVLAELERALKLQESGKVATGYDVWRREYAEKLWLLFSVACRSILANSAVYHATEAAPTDTEAAPNDNKAINTKPVGSIPSLQLYELKEITDNFSTKALICDGTCGKLYYGILKSGQASCIKMLEFNKLPLQDFLSRVHRVSRRKHENVIQLLGYCIDVDLCFLAYEYAPNGSLHDILHRRKGIKRLQLGTVLSWSQRVKIAVGAAKGLQYFHEKPQPNIIHGGIKSSNVLLFNDGIAKIADIKFSNRTLDVEPTLPYDYTTWFVGPNGFAALKQRSSRSEKLRSKHDVVMFGVVLLELLTGRKAVDYTLPRSQQNLIIGVNECIDPRLNGEYPLQQAAEMAAIAALCVQCEPVLRPSMSIVVNRLQPLLNGLPGTSSEATHL
ncbi:hypothetical protein LguiB_026153 [Lonicera macranthoides]